MAPIAGRPFLEILLGQLAGSGCGRVLLSVGYCHQVIQDYFGASYLKMRLDYVIEDQPLGTGGALRAALRQTEEGSTLVLNGDTLLKIDYAELLRFHGAQSRPLTLAVVHQDDVARYGGVRVEQQRIAGFAEKGRSGPGWINAGVYALNKDLAWPEFLGESFSLERDFLMPRLGELSPAAFVAEGYFLDIGVPEDLDRAQSELAHL